MKINKEKDNTLIKRNKLVKILKEKGIKRISPKALERLEKILTEYLMSLSESMREKIITKGKKTLEREDVSEIFKEKTIEQYWEI